MIISFINRSDIRHKAASLMGGGSSSLIKYISSLISSVFITLFVSAIVLVLGLLPNNPLLLEVLSFDYSAIIKQQQYWRLITSHLVHSAWDHLFWDLITFTVASAYLERQSRNLMIFGLILSILLIDLYMLSPLSTIAYYAGISGVLYTVITLAGLFWYREEKGGLALLPIIIIAVKTLIELTTQNAVFVTEGWMVYSPAHLLGAIAGIVLWCVNKEVKHLHGSFREGVSRAHRGGSGR